MTFETPTSININIIKLYIHQSKIKIYIAPYIETYLGIPMHVSGRLVSLWKPAISLFVRDKYVTPTGKRLHAGYVQKAEDCKTYHLIPQLAANNTVRVVQW